MTTSQATAKTSFVDGMNYKQFVRACQIEQIRYINDERRRMRKADRLWRIYKGAMALLGLHPPSPDEILARFRELDEMEVRVPETHGDGATMQFAYRRFTNSDAAAAPRVLA